MKSSVAPKKSLGQHFLYNDHYCRKIAATVAFEPGRTLTEIGPGTGALTRFLYPQWKDRYTGIELDRRSVEDLYKTLGSEIRILTGDFMEIDPDSWLNPEGKTTVIGNVPYYITTPILFRVLDLKNRVSECVVLIQKEVARRIISAPGSKDYGILSVQFQQAARCELLFQVPPGAFFPPPSVDSAVIRMTFYETPPEQPVNPDLFRTVVRTAFHARRKTLKNNLKPLIQDRPVTSVDLSRRAETLSVAEFVRLTDEIAGMQIPSTL